MVGAAVVYADHPREDLPDSATTEAMTDASLYIGTMTTVSGFPGATAVAGDSADGPSTAGRL